MSEYNFVWWNVENLFDVENSPNRSEKLERTLKNELKGWSREILNKKTNQLSKIISKANDGNSPDVLGVCEVENKQVIEILANKLQESTGKNYHIVHADTQDRRGIDIAFLYDEDKFEIEKDAQTGEPLVFSHFILRREATRDILQVNFKAKPSNKRLVVIGNHWPSRSGGQYESEPYRIVAGETLSYFHNRILEENNFQDNSNTPILTMGDFNDEPFNRSITDYALSTGSLLKVRLADSPRFYNLMWSLMTNGTGTFYFNNFPNMLDQFMISKGIVLEKGLKIKELSTKIIKFTEMAEGRYEVPKKFGRPSDNSLNEQGFSDHFPISVTLEETP
jgi:predicted extracellular nuclease